MLQEWEYGEFILNMRMAAGLTRAALAEILKVTVVALKEFECGEVLPPDPDEFLCQLREVVKDHIQARRSAARIYPVLTLTI